MGKEIVSEKETETEKLFKQAIDVLNSEKLDAEARYVIKSLLGSAMENKDFRSENCIMTTNNDSHEKIGLTFLRAKIPFSFFPEETTSVFSEPTNHIYVHQLKPESWYPLFNLALSDKTHETVEATILKSILAKHKIDLVICPKKNDDKWDIVGD